MIDYIKIFGLSLVDAAKMLSRLIHSIYLGIIDAVEEILKILLLIIAILSVVLLGTYTAMKFGILLGILAMLGSILFFTFCVIVFMSFVTRLNDYKADKQEFWKKMKS